LVLPGATAPRFYPVPRDGSTRRSFASKVDLGGNEFRF
jgi:hypothetical protein